MNPEVEKTSKSFPTISKAKTRNAGFITNPNKLIPN